MREQIGALLEHGAERAQKMDASLDADQRIVVAHLERPREARGRGRAQPVGVHLVGVAATRQAAAAHPRQARDREALRTAEAQPGRGLGVVPARTRARVEQHADHDHVGQHARALERRCRCDRAIQRSEARHPAGIEMREAAVRRDVQVRIALARDLRGEPRRIVQAREVDREVHEFARQPGLEHARAALADRARAPQLRDGLRCAFRAHSSSPRPFTVASISGGGIEPSV